MRCRIVLLATWLAAFATACGDGSTPEPAPPADECLRDPDCNDNVACTDDVCGLSVNGARRCEHIPRAERCPDGSECLTSGPLGSGCVARAALWCAGRDEGDSCQPDDECALGDGTCHLGQCQFTRRECVAQACLVSLGCDAATGRCRYGPEPAGTVCDADGLDCSRDECRDGSCIVAADDCQCTPQRACPAPADACLQAGVCESGTCRYDPVACPPDETCRHYACDPGNGQCVPTPTRQGEACDDGLACTVGDTCEDGECRGQARVCDLGPCRSPGCAEPGGCIADPLEDMTPCDDADACNGPDMCLEGNCVPAGPGVQCDDGDDCTADSCRAPDGLCLHHLVPDCCGNGIREAGEDCDPGRDVAPLCDRCRFVTAQITARGSVPALAWSPASGWGWIAWEDTGDDEELALRLRTVDAQGRLGGTGSIETAGPGLSGHYVPALASLSDGRTLLSFLEGDGIGLRLLGLDGQVVSEGRISGVLEAGDTPGRILLAGAVDQAVLLVWEVRYANGAESFAKTRAAWVLFAGGEILNSIPFPVAGDTAKGISTAPGDLCVGDNGGLVMLLTLAGDQVISSAVFVGVDGRVRPPWDLVTTSRSLRVPPRCAAWSDRTFRVAWASPVQEGDDPGIEASGASSTAVGLTADSLATLARLVPDGVPPEEALFPAVGALEVWGEGLAWITGWLAGESLSAPASLGLRVVPWSGGTDPGGEPRMLEGASDGFTLDLDVTPGPAGAMLLAWQWMADLDTDLAPSPVRVRLLAAP